MQFGKRKVLISLVIVAAFAAVLSNVDLTSMAQLIGKEQIEEPSSDTSILRSRGKRGNSEQSFAKTSVGTEPEGLISTTEIEPNETFATATRLGASSVRIRGDIFPNADVDFYSFNANAGDRVFAATMTSAGQGGTNSTLDLIAPDGTTVIESDLDDGSFSATSSSIAGRSIASSGIHYLRVISSTTTSQIRFYDLYLQVQSGLPGTEIEPNDLTTNATPLNPARFMSGAVSSATDAADFYSFTANAGDTIFLSLDMDPERDGVVWNGRLGVGTFSNFILLVNDANIVSPNSESHFFTVQDSGTYFAFVDPSVVGSGTATSTYGLSVTVFPQRESRCTTYTTATAPQPIGPDPASPNAVQTINIPDSRRISRARINVNLTHNLMADVDLNVTTPQGNELTLFNDVGSATAGAAGLLNMDINFDDDAAIPVNIFAIVSPVNYQPELFTRLSWLRGTNSLGTWTITARDDLATNSGMLNSWSVTICEDPTLTSIPALETTILNAGFETGDDGFTHSGLVDEWERGLPNTNLPGTAVFTNCNTGVNCWKTDLDNTYDNGSLQELVSPNIDLTAQRGRAIRLSWAHKYQFESATFDHYWVDVSDTTPGGLTRRVFEHRDGVMIGIVGNPDITLQTSVGWSAQEVDISEFAGRTVRVTFHVDSDSSVVFSGAAVDDVRVVALRTPPSADFNGDGGTDFSVYRTNGEDGPDGRWYVFSPITGMVTTQLFGRDTDTPVPGDYDGDGDIDIAVFRPSENLWFISLGSAQNFDIINWGTVGDIPVAGDYDGDGRTDAAVFRPSNQTWFIRRSSDGIPQFAFWGLATDRLVPNDYDGDGRTDVAVFRDGTWFIQQSFYGTNRIEQFGTVGDIPVSGDYDGDRMDDLAVFRPSTGLWFVLRSSSRAVDIISWGIATDIPVPGDYDRDRRNDFAVYRPSEGFWYIRSSSDNALFGGSFGISTDTPIPTR